METLQLQEITVLQQQINLCTSLSQYSWMMSRRDISPPAQSTPGSSGLHKEVLQSILDWLAGDNFVVLNLKKRCRVITLTF